MAVAGLSSKQNVSLLPGVPAAAPVPTSRATRGPRMNSSPQRLGDTLVRMHDVGQQVARDGDDGRFTLDQVLANLFEGLKAPFVELWTDLRDHPVRQVAAFLGMAAVTALLPLVGTVVTVVELGRAAFKLCSSLFEMVGFLRKGEPDEAERAFSGVGEGLGEALMVAVESWVEKVVDINRAIPKSVAKAFRTARQVIGRIFGFGTDGPDDD